MSLTPQRRLRISAVLVLSLGLGCSSGPAAQGPATEPAVAAPSTGAEAKLPDAAQLVGRWVEFWALSGKAETQAYSFAADGTFEWRAAPGAPGPQRRWGRYSVQDGVLQLEVAGEEPPPTQAVPAVRTALGTCPPDQEARAVDASYRCLSFDGRAFWHRGS